MADLISREAALVAINEFYHDPKVDIVLRKLPAVDAVEVVRCKDCRWGVESDMYKSYKCTIDADYDEDAGDYIGFVEWHRADHFCSYGKRREENGWANAKDL